MITVYIYLKQERDAEMLSEELLLNNLVAHACIDRENISMKRMGKDIVKELNFVITAQTRALLFDKIVGLIEERYGELARVFAQPITQCNKSFYTLIQENTTLLAPNKLNHENI